MIKTFSFAVLLFLFGFTTTALAADAATGGGDGSLLDLARPVFDAVMHGQWWLGAALGVVFLCALARKYLPERYKTGIRGDVTGIGLAFAMSFAGALATGLAAIGTNALSGALAFTAFKVAIVAAGGYSILHKLATALTHTAWFQLKAPAWLKTALAFIMMIIGSNAVAKAEAAGDAAVKANPAPGAAPTSFEQF